MTNKLREFLQQQDIQEALQEYNFKYIYEIPWERSHLSANDTSEFTELLLSLGYNPLDYMDYIPGFFLYESNIEEFKIPIHIKSIGEDAFSYCANLTSITIPNSVKKIGYAAFYRCGNLTNITIPSSVTSIGRGAFYECNSLETIYYEGTQEDWNKIEIKSENEDLLNANIIFKK